MGSILGRLVLGNFLVLARYNLPRLLLRVPDVGAEDHKELAAIHVGRDAADGQLAIGRAGCRLGAAEVVIPNEEGLGAPWLFLEPLQKLEFW